MLKKYMTLLELILTVFITSSIFILINRLSIVYSKNKKLLMEIKRNEDVYHYRASLIERGVNIESFASYSEMFESRLPLEDFYWIPPPRRCFIKNT